MRGRGRGKRRMLSQEEDEFRQDSDSLDGLMDMHEDLQAGGFRKKPPKNKKKVQWDGFVEQVEKDPRKRRMLANEQHVPVRFQAGQGMDINIEYDDGRVRKFGQQNQFEEKFISVSKSGSFYYEHDDRKKPVYTGRSRDDTRSLFDDPQMQKLRGSYTPRMLQKFTQGIYSKDDEEINICDGQISWKPVKVIQEVPKTFYMQESFDRNMNGPRNIDAGKIKNEYDAFRIYFDEEIYKQIILFTKERYSQKVNEAINSYIHGTNNFGQKSKKPTFQNWEFNEFELEAYFAVQIFFGIVRLSNQRDYWKASTRAKPYKKVDLGSRRKFKEIAQEKMDRYSHWVTQRMSSIIGYEKFKTIKGCLNIAGADALKNKPRDPIWKIRSFLNQMNAKFQKFYYPGEFLTIDEGMIPFAGKVTFKVYNPDKPTPWGIKEYLLCDAATCYTFQVVIYSGTHMWENEFKKATCDKKESDPEIQAARTLELVLQMIKDYEHKNHKVVMDNYYSSWQLFRELRNRGLGAVGTIRHNRTGLCKKDLTSKHFQQIYHTYHYAFYLNHSNELMLMYFQGTSEKEIALISNFLDNSQCEQHLWDISKSHFYNPHPKSPYMMFVYNKYKGGVDRRNSYVVKYRSRFPAKKWWQSIFERLFETAILNAYLIFKSYNPETTLRNKQQMRDFRINLMYAFAERYKSYEASEVAQRKNNQYLMKQQPHTFVQGEETLPCMECGKPTKTFCQECTILNVEVYAFCDETQSLKCSRFHEFSQIQEFFREKENFDKKKGKQTQYPNHYQEMNQRTLNVNKQTLIDAEKNEKKQQVKDQLKDILQQLSEQAKLEQQMKDEKEKDEKEKEKEDQEYILDDSDEESSDDSQDEAVNFLRQLQLPRTEDVSKIDKKQDKEQKKQQQIEQVDEEQEIRVNKPNDELLQCLRNILQEIRK